MNGKRNLLAILLDPNQKVTDRKWVSSVHEAMGWAEAATLNGGYELTVYRTDDDHPVLHHKVGSLWNWKEQEG